MFPQKNLARKGLKYSNIIWTNADLVRWRIYAALGALIEHCDINQIPP